MGWGAEPIWQAVATFASGVICVAIGGIYVCLIRRVPERPWRASRAKRVTLNRLGTSMALSGVSLIFAQVVLWSDRLVS
jgi:hypothetical protein